ncbi:MAG TPA: response regulator transcription factor [bacterium]
MSDHPVVLANLRRILTRKGQRLAEVRLDGAGLAVGKPVKIPRARVLVIDAPAHKGTAQNLVQSALGQLPGAMVLVLAEKFSESTAFDFLRLGARGLMTYAEIETQAIRAVEALAGGNFWVPRALLGRFVDSILSGQNTRAATAAEFKLSARERQVLDALLDNLANKEIAVQLNISERTVKFHVSHLLSKFNVQRRADLIVLFYQTRKPLP